MAVEIKKINGVYMGSQEIASTRFAGDANLVGYWRMESNGNDSSANGYNLTFAGSPSYVAGKFGNAIDLEVSTANQFFSIANASCANLEITGSQTWGAWVNLESLGVNNLLMAKNSGGAHIKQMYINTSNNLVFQMTGLSDVSVTGTVALTSGVWHQVIGRYNGSAIEVFLNGVKIGSDASTGSAGDTDGVFYIGSNAGSSGFDGLVDDAFVFDRALTDDEIYSLYKTGVKKLNGQVNLNPELESTSLRGDENLVAYYKSEDVNDSKNSFNLTNSNVVAFNAAKFNNGADFGASNNSKSLYITNTLGITGGSISISTWIKLQTEIGSSIYSLVAQEDVSSRVSNLLCYDYNGGTRRINFWRVRQGVAIDGGAYNITLGTSSWYHIVYTYDGSNIMGYVNGSLVFGPSASSGNGTSGGVTVFSMGSNYAGATWYSSHISDDTAIFSRALTPTEISNLYNTNIKKYGGVSNT